MKKYPFFIIVDDGGFKSAGHGDQKIEIDMETYSTILKIARKFNITIPICFTMKYLDKENISGYGTPLEYADELVDFLNKNKKWIEIGYHGLTHEYKGHTGEFYCLDTNEPIPEEIQREHIEKSAKIFWYWNLKFSELFVPPYHAWELGVTDKILSEYGVKYLISHSNLKYGNYTSRWGKSRYLIFLPREHIGILSYHTNLNEDQLKIAKKAILPRNIINNLRFRRTVFNKPVHSYMTHIGNFMPKNYDFWVEILSMVNNKKCILCRNNQEAIRLYNEKVGKDDRNK
jgi:hypothetical protein